MAKKISEEVAVQEFEQWLDFKRVRTRKREANKDFQQSIVDEMVEGNITIDEKKVITFILPDPVQSDEGKDVLTELKFQPRIKVHKINDALKGTDSTNADARILAYIKAITGVNSGLIQKLDTVDYSVCQAIVMYFL